MNKKLVAIIAGAIALVAVIIILVFALKGGKGYRQIKVDEFNGEVSVTGDNVSEASAYKGMTLVTNDTVDVASESNVVLLVDEDKHIAADENTKFAIEASGKEKNGKVSIKLLEGKALFTIDNKLPKKSTFDVTTKNAVMSVRGTEFEVAYDPVNDVTTLEVLNGVVNVKRDGESKGEDIKAGEVRAITSEDIYEGSTVEEALQAVLGMIAGGSDGGSSAGNASVSSDLTVPVTSNTPKGIIAAYNTLVSNMASYVEESDAFNQDYVSYDYMYYDYDGDGQKEVILYLRYFDDKKEMYLDLGFMDYSESQGQIYLRATHYNDYDSGCFYGDYNGKLGRYSWITKPMESYLYSLDFRGDTLIYVLEKGFDSILTDYEKEGIKPLPLYGSWEMIFEE